VLRGGRRAAEHRTRVQARVPERVVAAGWAVARPGSARPGDAGDAGWPSRVWLAVTASRLYCFTAEGDGVGALLGAWDRSDVTATASAALTATRLRLAFAGHGSGLELDARRGVGNGELVRVLRNRAEAS
jgi:hypothetical protein